MKVVQTYLLDEIVARLTDEFDPEQIILFGSHAWGEPNDDSDLDLCVIVAESNERPARRSQKAHLCLGDLPVPKDIVVMTREEIEKFRDVYASLECLILEKGKVLYDRGKAQIGGSLDGESFP
jgi:uncharacterized protein